MENETIHNQVVKQNKFLLILCCFGLFPFAPFIILYLIINWKPNETIAARITNKDSQFRWWRVGNADTGFVSNYNYYITIGQIKLKVSRKIYGELTTGDYISAAYRKTTLYYYTKLN